MRVAGSGCRTRTGRSRRRRKTARVGERRARFDVIKIFGAHSFKYKIRTGRSTRSGDLYITTLRRYRYNLRDRWARAERGEARCEEATEATRPPERGSKGGSEAHTTMSACREEWGALCASGRGGATVTRDSGGATLCQVRAACRGGGASDEQARQTQLFTASSDICLSLCFSRHHGRRCGMWACGVARGQWRLWWLCSRT